MKRFVLPSLAALALTACGDGPADAPEADDAASAPAPASAPAMAESEAPADAAAQWRVDQAQSALDFAGSVDGEGFEGGFSGWTADIWFDPDNLAGSKIDARVNLASLDSGDSERDETALSADWLGTGTARFVSDEISVTGDGYAAAGTLSVKGVSNPVTLPFTVTINGDTAQALAEFGFNRADWDVGGGDFDGAVSDSITVTADITASR